MPQHDFTLADAPGLPMRQDMQAGLQALATCSSGATEPATPYAGMLWLDTSVSPNGQLRQRNQANSAWIAIAGFPVKASSAETIAGTDDAKFSTPLGVASRQATLSQAMRNRVVNGAMQISQQNGDSVGTVNTYYAADQWLASFSTTGAVAFQRISSITPKKSRKRIQIAVNTIQAVLGANDALGLRQPLEGIRIGDFGWGAAGARQVILRFGFKGPAGTYAASIRNGGAVINRSYAKTFTITAGQAFTDTEQIIVVPGDITGTWPTDNTVGLHLNIQLAAGSGLASPADGTWQAGNYIGVAGMTNGLGANAVFEIFDAGLYLDGGNTGVPPPWEMPDEAAELLACQRYYCAAIQTMYHGGVTSGSLIYVSAYTTVDMRIATPALAGVSSSASNFPAAPGTGQFFSPRSLRENRTPNGTGTGVFSTVWTVDARM